MGIVLYQHLEVPLCENRQLVEDALDWADAANCETFGEDAGWDVTESQMRRSVGC